MRGGLSADEAFLVAVKRMGDLDSLSREFARYFATSFSAYVRIRKVEQARRLLLTQPHLPLADVAYQCGFADQSHFGRCFRQLTGRTPGQFRRQG